MPIRKEGQYNVADFFGLTGGLNTAFSPFMVEPNQATDGYNYDYFPRGAVSKRYGHLGVLSSIDTTNTTTLGFGVHDNFAVRTPYRAAGRVIKALSGAGGTSVTQGSSLTSDDSSPVTNIWATSTTSPVVSAMFNTASKSILWMAGGDATWLTGLYSDNSGAAPAYWTKNGADAPTVTKLQVKSSGAGSGPPTGTYYNYTLTLVKGSTGAESNALSGDLQGTPDATYQTTPIQGTGFALSLSWTFTGVDTTKYTQVKIYRSSPGTSATDGDIASGFTAGVLLATQAIGTTTYSDTNTFESSSANIPRAGNTVLDNSMLPSSVKYNTCVAWQNRLVTSTGSTLYISDTNKSESWPTVNIIQVPSLGAITGLATLSLVSSVSSTGIVEALCIFKEREMWALVGNSYADWVLTQVSTEGCPNQSLVVRCGGNLAWLNYRGVFLWNGGGKPRYVSSLIEDKFQPNGLGDIVLSSLYKGFGLYSHQKQQVQWYISSNNYGTQKYCLKLDLRISERGQSDNILNAVTTGIFTADTLATAMYGGMSFTTSGSSTNELIYLGDSSGQVYHAYITTLDSKVVSNVTATESVEFSYTTPEMHFDKPEVRKTLTKVILWIKDNGVGSMYMDYWSDYKSDDVYASTAETDVSANPDAIAGIWDSAIWDTSTFNAGGGDLKPVVFHVNSQTQNNASGMSFRLRFRSVNDLDSPIIYGYSVYYTEAGTGF